MTGGDGNVAVRLFIRRRCPSDRSSDYYKQFFGCAEDNLRYD